MRVQIKSTSQRFNAPRVKIGRKSIIVLTEDERLDIPIPDGIPEGMEIPEAGTELHNVQVSTNASGDVLYSLFPSKGTHIVKFYKFSSKEGEDPSPRTLPGKDCKRKDGKGTYYRPDKQVFTALLKVVAGEFTGCIIPWMLDYAFERDHDGSAFVNSSGRTVERISNFLTLCGLDVANETLRWKENILPDLEMILSERTDNFPFQVIMRDGWIDEASELPAGFNPKAVKTQTEEDVVEIDAEEEANPWTGKKDSQPVVYRGSTQVQGRLSRATNGRLGNDDEIPDEEDDRPEVPAKKVTRPVATKVVVTSDADDDEDWDEDEAPAKPVAQRTGKKRDVF